MYVCNARMFLFSSRRRHTGFALVTGFSDVCSSDLTSPLNAIIGFSELMSGEVFGPLSERYRDYAQDICYSGNLLLDLINDILDLSKIEANRHELREEIVDVRTRSEEHTSELQSLMRISYAVFCLKKKTKQNYNSH